MSNMIVRKPQGDLLELIIDNQDHGNAVSDEMAAQLTAALNEAAASAEFVILRGAGPDFCTGRLSMGKRTGERPEALARRRKTEVIFDCYDAFRRANVPIIAVVRGRAHGFGCAIAALCDITIAAETATFKVPEMAHNILPTMVMSALIDCVPRKVLSYLVYSTAEISALEAVRCGLASKVVSDDRVETEVAGLIAAMRGAPRPALRGVKEFTRSAYDMPIRGAIDYAQNLHATINSSIEMSKQEQR